MRIRPIVLIGNGPSISGFDWNRLDGIDTMAMNAFNKVCVGTGWYPSHYCVFRRVEGIWGDEQTEFIRENAGRMANVFYLDTVDGGGRLFGNALDGICGVFGLHKVQMANPPAPRYGGVRWREAYASRFDRAVSILSSKVGDFRAREIVASSELPDDEFLVGGMVKWFLRGEKATYGPSDFSDALGWSPSFMRPKSFSEFYAGPGDSSTDCARVASLLGYNLILLVGFDGRIGVSESGVVDPSSWGIPNVFNGQELNLNSMVDCPVCRTTEGLDEKRRELWSCFLFSESLARNPMTVWNCTPGSALTNIEQHDLNETLDMIRNW